MESAERGVAMTISIAEKLADTYAEHLNDAEDPHMGVSIAVILTELLPMMEDIKSEAITEYLNEKQYPNEGHYNHDAHWPSSYGVR